MITEHRDLRTGLTYWQARGPLSLPVRPLARDISTDILVVGAGITGAIIAELLSEKYRVALVDRRGPAAGSTAASTALVEYEIDVPLIHLADQIGSGRAARVWSRSYEAVRALLERTRMLGIDCDIAERESLYLSGDVLDADELGAETELRARLGFDVEFLDGDALRQSYAIHREAAIRAVGDFTVDPRRMAAGFLGAAIKRGAAIYAPTDIADIERDGSGIAAITVEGPVIRARAVVLATGYELPKCVPRAGHQVVSTYAVATVPQPEALWRNEALIWEACDPYLYIRTTPDRRVICGGEDEEFADEAARDALIPAKAKTIAGKLKRLMPHLDVRLDFAWAGAFGASDTGLPSIGEVPGLTGCWSVVGFGGNGMTYSRIAAEIIAAALAGREDSDAALFAFKGVGAAVAAE
ncbi:FAD-binding oxidoreductase [soil metagenome]